MLPFKGVRLRGTRWFNYSGVKTYSIGIYCLYLYREGGWFVGGGLITGRLFLFGALIGSRASYLNKFATFLLLLLANDIL